MLRSFAQRGAALSRSPFARSVGGMLGLTAMGQGIYVLSAPFIGRFYAPEQVGLYGLFFTIAATAAGFMCLLYDFAIPAAHTDDEARRLTIGALVIALVLSGTSGALLSLLSWADFFGLGQLPVWAGAAMALILLAQAAIQVAQGWLIRRQEPLAIGRMGISLNAGRGGTQVLGGIPFPYWWMLVLGELLGRVLSLLHVRWAIGALRSEAWPTFAEVTACLRRYREFALVLVPAQGIDAIVIVIQVSGLSFLFGPAALGQYYLMRRTLDLPVALAFKSLSDIFYARIALFARTTPDEIRPFFTKAFLLLLALGVVAATPVIFFGPQLFRLVFGPGWESAGLLAAVMVPAAVMNLAVAPVSRVFALTTRPSLRYALGLVSAPGTLGVLGATYWFEWSIFATTAGFSLVIASSYFAYFVAGYIASGHIRADASVKVASDAKVSELG